MEIESVNFTADRVDQFLDELFELDRQSLVARLRNASTRFEQLKGRTQRPVDVLVEGWSSVEIVAHIAVLSKFYGVLAYRIGKGELTELDFLTEVKKRDVLGIKLSTLPIAELFDRSIEAHKRTIEYLLAASLASLRQTCRIGADRWITSEEVARVALCAHLEQHIDQLEHSLA